MGSPDHEVAKSASKRSCVTWVRPREFLQTGGAYWHFQTSTSLLQARTFFTVSHLRDLAFPTHNHNFWLSKNMLMSTKNFFQELIFLLLVMVFKSSVCILNNIIWLEEWKDKVTLMLNPSPTNSFQFPVLFYCLFCF